MQCSTVREMGGDEENNRREVGNKVSIIGGHKYKKWRCYGILI